MPYFMCFDEGIFLAITETNVDSFDLYLIAAATPRTISLHQLQRQLIHSNKCSNSSFANCNIRTLNYMYSESLLFP